MADLTTLDAVKAWLPDMASVATSDALLAQLITAASQFICNSTGRSTFDIAQYSEDYDGNGHDFMLLRQWPVVQVASIGFGAVTITQASSGTPSSTGYRLEPPLPAGGCQRLSLVGQVFPRGRGNVTVSYSAGYGLIPPDVAQAAIELVGERFKARERIGLTAKTLGGQETTGFSGLSMNATVAALLAPYRRVVPC